MGLHDVPLLPRPLRWPALPLVVIATLVGACTSSATLDLSLRTDLVGGVEFTSVRTELRRDSGEVVRAAELTAMPPPDWSRPRRIAELDGLPPGELLLNVTLFDSLGRVSAQRNVRVTFASERLALTVLVTRDCRGVSCPGASDRAVDTTCLGGRCVPPECSELDPSACPTPECASASDCPSPAVPCASADCVEGVCIQAANGSCAADEYCDLVLDCVPLSLPDGGAPDAGTPRDAGGDAATSGCTDGLPCDTGDPCALGQTHCVGGVPECQPSGPAPASTVCRPSVGACDVEETCGGAMTCPADALAPTTMECRASTAACDAAERCTGASPDCPGDDAAPDGTICPSGVCNHGACVPCTTGLPCSPGRACERGTIDCTTTTPTCRSAGAEAMGTPCRASAGPCDAAESCDGTGLDCPADAFLGASTTCRAATDACDVAETCDGSSAACPADAFAPSTTVCRTASGACDVADRCSGTSAACPGDLVRPSTLVCRAAVDVCDVADNCDGVSPVCPADVRAPSGTSCRSMTGPCDVAEACDGTHVGCPSDGYAAMGTSCRASVGPCDAPDVCSGGSAACPDLPRSDGTTCPGGVCSSGSCVACTPGLACALPNACERGIIDCASGSPVCISGGPKAMGTTCRAAAGICDHVEVCDGTSLTCPADTFLSGPTCRMAASVCDVAETCSGSSAACPMDLLVADGTACGSESCGSYGACTGMGCNLMSGMQSRTCTTPVCSGGTCTGSQNRDDSQSCTRSASCPDACCNGNELGDDCSMDCGPFPTGIDATGSVLTPAIGPSGGASFMDTCAPDMVIMALYFDTLGTTMSVTWMEGVGFYCGPLTYSTDHGTSPPRYVVTTGFPYTYVSPAFGGSGWTTTDCPAGTVLVGGSISLDGPMPYVRGVEMHCTTLSVSGRSVPGATFVQNATQNATALPTWPVGGAFGAPMLADCPAGTVARGIHGSYDPMGVTALGFVCERITPR